MMQLIRRGATYKHIYSLYKWVMEAVKAAGIFDLGQQFHLYPGRSRLESQIWNRLS